MQGAASGAVQQLQCTPLHSLLQCGDTLLIIIHTTIAGVSIHNITIFYCIMHFMLQLSSQIVGQLEVTTPLPTGGRNVYVQLLDIES